MPCFHPLKGYRSRSPNASGRHSLVFNPKFGYIDQPVEVACGRCIGCRLERARQWGVRLDDENRLWLSSCYLTFTYSDECVPHDGSLNHRHVQLLVKRLRARLNGEKIRYYMCGEYGEDLGRPHYHMILFGYRPDDLVFWKDSKGHDLFRSPFLEKLWKFGMVFVGEVTFDSAAYCAGYITKKITGEKADEHYQRVNLETGEIFWLKPEYCAMSNGLGRGVYDRFRDDMYPHDSCVVKGKEQKPPRYYDNLYALENPEGMKRIKDERTRKARKRKEDNTPERLRVRETVTNARLRKFKRQ